MQESGRDSGRSHWKARYELRLVVVVLVVLGMSLTAVADSGRVNKRDSRIDFSTNLDQGLEKARASGLPVYLAFGAVWCPVCRRSRGRWRHRLLPRRPTPWRSR